MHPCPPPHPPTTALYNRLLTNGQVMQKAWSRTPPHTPVPAVHKQRAHTHTPVIAAHVNELRERSLPRGAASPGVLLSGSSGFRATGRGRLPRGSAINGDH